MFTIPEAEGPNPPEWALKHVTLTRAKIRTWENQNGKCCFCRQDTWLLPFSERGSKGKMATAEHVICAVNGGGNGYSNIVMSCAKCNQERDVMDALEYWELHQDPKVLQKWREDKAEAKRIKQRASQRRAERRRIEATEKYQLTHIGYQHVLEHPDMTMFDAYHLTLSKPWKFPSLCSQKSSQPSLGVTAGIARSYRSLMARLADMWLSETRRTSWKLVDASKSPCGQTTATSSSTN